MSDRRRHGAAPVLLVQTTKQMRSRWRTAISVVTLAAAVGVSVTTAHALPTPVTFYMDISRPKLTLCVRQKVQYTATVRAAPQGDKVGVAVPNIRINATSSDPSIGSFTGGKHGQASALSAADPSQNLSHGVVFGFQAGKKEGLVRLAFLAQGLGDDVSGVIFDHIDVRVVNCTFLVSAVANYDQDPTDNPGIPFPSLTTSMKRVKLKVDPTDGHIEGKTTLRWTNAFLKVLCSVSEKIAGTSGVTITGAIEDYTLVLNFTFAEKSRSATVKCDPAEVPGFAFPVAIASLKMDVDTEGGTYVKSTSYGSSAVGGVKGVMIVTVKAAKP
jgi:hypothetical protein